MKIGIVGSGNIGGTVGRLWAQAGHVVVFSFSRDPAKRRDLADSAGNDALAGTPEQAAHFGEVVLFAPPWPVAEEAIAQAGSLAGRVVVDTTNPYGPGMPLDGPASAGEEVAKRMPGARLVKAYNTLPAATLQSESGRPPGDRLALFLCGDDEATKATVAGLVVDSGFAPVGYRAAAPGPPPGAERPPLQQAHGRRRGPPAPVDPAVTPGGPRRPRPRSNDPFVRFLEAPCPAT